VRFSARGLTSADMRIVEDNPARLAIVHRPRILPAFFLGCALVLGVYLLVRLGELHLHEQIGLILGTFLCALASALTATQSECRFDAQSGQVSWRHRGVFARSSGELPLQAIEGVGVETDRDAEGQSYRVVLATRHGRVPLTWHYSTIEPHTDIARAICCWLRLHGIEVPDP